jgi:predicted DNA-binding ribbon-helix-helix protein
VFVWLVAVRYSYPIVYRVIRIGSKSPAPTERWTLHIEKPFIEKIKAEAEAEHITVTEIINRIIRHYYAGS